MAIKNERGETIKARRAYHFTPAAESADVVHVAGFEKVEVGVEGSRRWPLKVETWCRERGTGMLVHPDRLTPDPELVVTV